MPQMAAMAPAEYTIAGFIVLSGRAPISGGVRTLESLNEELALALRTFNPVQTNTPTAKL
jgi:hypothetical protein